MNRFIQGWKRLWSLSDTDDPIEEQRRKQGFYRHPILSAIGLSAIPSALITLYAVISTGNLLDSLLGLVFPIIFLPLILTIANLWYLLINTTEGIRRKAAAKMEIFTLMLGIPLTALYFSFTSDGIDSTVIAADWWEQLYAFQLHSPVELASIPTIVALTLVGFGGYLILRLMPLSKQPPLLTALSIAAMYVGGAVAVVWILQIHEETFYLPQAILPLNLILLYLRTLRLTVHDKAQLMRQAEAAGERPRLSTLARFLDNASTLPLAGLMALLPLLGAVIFILVLFGQQPDAAIRAWTQTADWTFSQQIPPPNIPYEGHYLCTVAAGGHRKVVKPIRTGVRHGHRVVVNRQLCIANAFEQLLEERTPRFHRFVRNSYDRYGLPIAKLIRTKFAADVVYILMKPAEWIFLAVLYLFDRNPENRIALQYPHKEAPKQSDI